MKPTINFLDPDYCANPHPLLARVRAENPIHQDMMGSWYVTRHADVVAVLKDSRLGRDLRKWVGYEMVRPYLAGSPLERCIEQWMFSVDPPAHTRLRRLVARAFTPRAVAAMRGAIEEVADDILNELRAKGSNEVELIAEVAKPFPVRVIARVLGLPVTIYEQVTKWSSTVALAVEPTAQPDDRNAANDAAVELMAYLREEVSNRRERRDGDVVSMLLEAADDGDRLSEDELISQLVLLFIAGHETTTNLIGNGLLALCRNPDQLQHLRDDPSLGPSAIEEMLRYEPPATIASRVTHADIAIGDQVIGAGQLVLCVLGSANRDEAVFPEPDRFDIGRTPNPHESFGGGIHHCLGAPLARLEAQVGIERILRNFRTIEVVEEGVRRHNLVLLRGPSALPVRVTWA